MTKVVEAEPYLLSLGLLLLLLQDGDTFAPGIEADNGFLPGDED